LGQQIIDARALLQPAAELVRPGSQRLVAERLDVRLELPGGAHGASVATDEPLVAAAEDAGEELAQELTRLPENSMTDKHLPRVPGFESGVLYEIDVADAQLVRGRGNSRRVVGCAEALSVADEGERIHLAAVAQHFEVHVRSGRAAGRAHERDGLAALHHLADGDQRALVVGV